MFLRKCYPTIASSNGTGYLAKSLNKLQMQYIRETLPILCHNISSKLVVNESKLQALGEPEEDNGPVLLQTLTRFATAYCQKIEGRHFTRHWYAPTFWWGKNLLHLSQHFFRGTEPHKAFRRSRTDILHATSNSMGPRPALCNLKLPSSS